MALSIPCGVAFAAGSVYEGDGFSVRKISMATGQLTTPAGTGVIRPLGDGGPADRASVNFDCGVAVDHLGNLVIADQHDNRVRVAAASTGTFYGRSMTAGDIYTVAGNGRSGFAGDGGPGTQAKLAAPFQEALDGAGNVVFADVENSRIRVVAARPGRFYGQAMTAGDIYTVAGDGAPGFSGDGGPAAAAELFMPSGVAVDGAGNLVIADRSNGRVRVVAARTGRFYGQSMTAGDIYTVAGDGSEGFSGDGGPAISASLNTPEGAALDGAGNLVISDTGNSRIRVVAARSGRFYGQAMIAGDIYTVAGTGQFGFSGDGGPATSATLNTPEGVTLDGAGNLVIADRNNGQIRVVAARTGRFYGQAMTAGDVYTVAGNDKSGFAGNGGPATAAQFSSPTYVAADSAGNVLIADTENDQIQVVAARSGTRYGRAVTAGHVYSVAGTGQPGYSGDGGPGTKAAIFSPDGVTADSAGNVVLADDTNERVRVVAARSGRFYGQAMTAGDIYTVAGDGSEGFSGDGGPAIKAELAGPGALTLDTAGNLLIAEVVSDRVRVVAARSGRFYGQAMTAGDIYTVAGDGQFGFSGDGGPATQASFEGPEGVAVDHTGNLVLADGGNERVRVVAARSGRFYGQAMTAGDIYTVAGDGQFGFSGDGGPATSAELSQPGGVTVDSAGNVVIADSFNDAIRVVAAQAGTFYGQPMTADDIYTVAGKGGKRGGFAGDGELGTNARLWNPNDVALDPAGNLLIADTHNNRIRMLSP